MTSKEFALSLGEYPQTINAISNERRGINPALSIKLGNAFQIDEAYFMLLQAYYELEIERKRAIPHQAKPNLSKLRPILFWDTEIAHIDWEKQRKAIIRRVFERGNEEEILEIISFYDREIVKQELADIPQSLPSLAENVLKYLSSN
ncbi:MAG: DUF6922 domain-containing protein [Mangrovibacterium sp.]